MSALFHSSPHTENAVSVTLSFAFYHIHVAFFRVTYDQATPVLLSLVYPWKQTWQKNAGKSQEHSRDEREWKKRATGVTHREPARKSRVMEIHRADIYPETLSLLPIAQCHRCHIQYCQHPPIHRGNFTSFKCNIL